MATPSDEMRIPLQVGAELRVTNDGEVSVSNPEIEVAEDATAADAVLLYRFDARTKHHTFRLVDPVADHKHVKSHRRGD
jgi:hypothetical protein